MKKLIVALLVLFSKTAISQTASPVKEIKVNEQRIENRILELSKFGKDSSGKGYRVAFTKGDTAGRTWFTGLMKKPGLIHIYRYKYQRSW